MFLAQPICNQMRKSLIRYHLYEVYIELDMTQHDFIVINFETRKVEEHQMNGRNMKENIIHLNFGIDFQLQLF